MPPTTNISLTADAMLGSATINQHDSNREDKCVKTH